LGDKVLNRWGLSASNEEKKIPVPEKRQPNINTKIITCNPAAILSKLNTPVHGKVSQSITVFPAYAQTFFFLAYTLNSI